MIHKITQDTGFVDSKYSERSKKAKELGILVGAYHFLTGAPVEKQEDFFYIKIKRIWTRKCSTMYRL